MLNTPQLSLFDACIPSENSTPKKVDKSRGKRKVKGWKRKVTPEVFQAAMNLEEVPLNKFNWGESHMEMHDALLFESLSPCLGKNVSLDFLEEVIEWIIAPLVHEKSGMIKPFSFQACCLACGVDAAEMRDKAFPIVQAAQDKALNVKEG
jgi:hypothetical protein